MAARSSRKLVRVSASTLGPQAKSARCAPTRVTGVVSRPTARAPTATGTGKEWPAMPARCAAQTEGFSTPSRASAPVTFRNARMAK